MADNKFRRSGSAFPPRGVRQPLTKSFRPDASMGKPLTLAALDSAVTRTEKSPA